MKPNNTYIIVEIIPTHSNPKVGMIAQISALKIQDLKLLERFDYRLNENLIENKDLLAMITYDKDNFLYVSNQEEILNNFKKFIGNNPLLIIDNQYTLDYLKQFDNKKESVFNYLNLKCCDDVFKNIIEKYNLEPTDHIVDLLYEAYIYESNSK